MIRKLAPNRPICTGDCARAGVSTKGRPLKAKRFKKRKMPTPIIRIRRGIARFTRGKFQGWQVEKAPASYRRFILEKFGSRLSKKARQALK